MLHSNGPAAPRATHDKAQLCVGGWRWGASPCTADFQARRLAARASVRGADERMILAPQCCEKLLQAPASDAPHGACCAGVRGDLTRRWCGEGGRIRACEQRKNGSRAALRAALSGQGDLVNPNPN